MSKSDDELSLTRSVESFLGKILDQVVEDDERCRDNDVTESVKSFISALTDDVSRRLESERRESLGLTDSGCSRPSLSNGQIIDSRSKNDLSTIDKALRSVFPLCTMIVPKVAKTQVNGDRLKALPSFSGQSYRKESVFLRGLKALKLKKTASDRSKTTEDRGYQTMTEKPPGEETLKADFKSIENALWSILPVCGLVVPEVTDQQFRTLIKAEEQKLKFEQNPIPREKRGHGRKAKSHKYRLTFIESALRSNLPVAMVMTPTFQGQMMSEAKGDCVQQENKLQQIVKIDQEYSNQRQSLMKDRENAEITKDLKPSIGFRSGNEDAVTGKKRLLEKTITVRQELRRELLLRDTAQ